MKDVLIIKRDELLALAEERRFAIAREILLDIPAPDTAELLSELDSQLLTAFFRLLSKEKAAEVFVELDTDVQRELIERFSEGELGSILDEMYLDDTVDLIEEMPATVVKRIIRSAPRENRTLINKLLKFPKDSAGAIMTTEYVRFTRDMTVRDALAHIKDVAIDKETIYTSYVTDKERHLIGIVTARSLMLSEADTLLSDIMEEQVVYAETSSDKEEVANLFNRYGFIALPVVDSERRLVGIVTVDDAMDVMREETEEDFAKMAGITPAKTTYLKTSVLSIWKSRIPWLLLLMISATFSSTILNRFEAALPAVLILFVPMLMDTGGNSGGQTSVTVIRSLSLGEISPRDVLSVLWKELRVGLLTGISLGLVAFGKVMLVDCLIMQNEAVTLSVALAVAVTLAITVFTSKLIGALLPIGAKRIGLDPAVMASPFITTLVDAASLLLYFFIAGSVFSL
ncbi:MAG: magnesium transporter [Clostridia bacterium]|nr:magnesium transporter [Clostridia bacterium]